jgi:uncharacterized membrane protein YdjX (TVP38/TMEM64 family)
VVDSADASRSGTTSRWRWAARASIAVALAASLVALWSAWDREAMRTWKQEAGPVPFFGAMALLPAVGVPITPFFILAGATYGVRFGLLGSGVALAGNLALCYFIAGSALRPHLESLIRRTRYELPDFQEKNQSAVRFTLLTKLAPGVPGFLKNYILGMAGVPFGVYIGVSFATTGVYATALVVLGESLLEHDLRQALMPLAVFVVLGIGLWWWRKRSGRDATLVP